MLKASQNRKHYGKIRTLLLNCVKLLDSEQHPQVRWGKMEKAISIFTFNLQRESGQHRVKPLDLEENSFDLKEPDPFLQVLIFLTAHAQIIASAYYMLSELFQLDELPDEDGGESLRAGGSEDSYSDEDRDEEEGEDDDLTEDSEDIGSYSNRSRPQDDSKAVAVIRSVGELSVPEKYKSTHQIRVSHGFLLFSAAFSSKNEARGVSKHEVFILFYFCSQVVLFLFLKTKRSDADMS